MLYRANLVPRPTYIYSVTKILLHIDKSGEDWNVATCALIWGVIYAPCQTLASAIHREQSVYCGHASRETRLSYTGIHYLWQSKNNLPVASCSGEEPLSTAARSGTRCGSDTLIISYVCTVTYKIVSSGLFLEVSVVETLYARRSDTFGQQYLVTVTL